MKFVTRLASAALLFAFTACPVLADLGQTADELTKEFGEPKSKDDKASQMTWTLDGGLVYTVEFDSDGKSWMETVALAEDEGQAPEKSIGVLKGFADKEFGAADQWELVDAFTPTQFAGRDLKSVHGVVYWRLAKDGNSAYAMHVSGKPLIGVITPAYAKENAKSPIFAGY